MISAYGSDSAVGSAVVFEGAVAVSPILHHLGFHLAQVLPSEMVAWLSHIAVETPGTRNDGFDLPRSFLALDWLARTYLPTWIDLAGYASSANSFREAPQILDQVAATRFTDVAGVRPIDMGFDLLQMTAAVKPLTEVLDGWKPWSKVRESVVYQTVHACAGGLAIDFFEWSGAANHPQAVANRFGFSNPYWLALYAASARSTDRAVPRSAWVRACDLASRESWRAIGVIADNLAYSALAEVTSDPVAAVSSALALTVSDLQASVLDLFARMTYPT